MLMIFDKVMRRILQLLMTILPQVLLKYVHQKSGQYLVALDEKNKKKTEELWNEKFSGQPKFIFQLEESLKIILYKDSVLSKLIYNGFEKDEIGFTKKVLQQGDTFIDIGANIGLYSLCASARVGVTGRVISFEPSSLTYQRLLENIRINNFTNIASRNIGLSDKEGRLVLNQSDNGFEAWNTFAKGEIEKFQSVIEVNVSTLDFELKGIEKDKISLIKIDVEGWEKFVLCGASHLLTNYSPVIIVEFTETNTFAAGYFVQDIYDLMERFGYEWFRYKEGKLIKESKQLHYPYDNLIATKNVVNLRNRLSEN